MTNTRVAEAFAEGKTTGSSLHMFIDGDTIFSYGYHFPIARRTDKIDEAGKSIVLFTNRGYSVTTSSHKAKVNWALYQAGFRIIETDISGRIDQKAINGLRKEYDECLLKASRARKEWSIENWKRQVTQKREDIETLQAKFITE